MASPRVLVIEDDPRLMTLLTVVLEGGGYAVAASDSARGAVALTRSVQPDVIVLDLALPDRLEASLLAEFKADPAAGHIPVIVVSEHAEYLPAEGRALVTAVLPKPFSPRELLAAVRAAHGLPEDA